LQAYESIKSAAEAFLDGPKKDDGALGSLNVKEAGTGDWLVINGAQSTIFKFCNSFSTAMFFQSTFTGSVEFMHNSLDLECSVASIRAFLTLDGGFHSSRSLVVELFQYIEQNFGHAVTRI